MKWIYVLIIYVKMVQAFALKNFQPVSSLSIQWSRSSVSVSQFAWGNHLLHTGTLSNKQ